MPLSEQITVARGMDDADWLAWVMCPTPWPAAGGSEMVDRGFLKGRIHAVNLQGYAGGHLLDIVQGLTVFAWISLSAVFLPIFLIFRIFVNMTVNIMVLQNKNIL